MFSQVCVCSQEVGGTHPLPDTCDATGYGQQAGGTNPTGMLSCLDYFP